MSIVEIICSLFNGFLRDVGSNDPQRDRFILSKGHAALTFYAALYHKGIITQSQLEGYCTNGSLCGVHPEHHLPGVDFTTGSLGHGLAIGAGVALAARMQGQSYRCCVVVSDAECNEGSLWESVMFAGHHKLSNLVVVIDDNGQQAFGKTKDVIALNPLGDKWRAFGWRAIEVDGHDMAQLNAALSELTAQPVSPGVIVAKTSCGKGVSFMEGKVEWHYLPLSDDQFRQAMAEVEATEKT